MNEIFETPILLLIFNRPDLTQQVFDQVKKIKPKYLYVAADGPRLNNKSDEILCKKTRAIFDQINWDCHIKTLFREKNIGCGLAVSSAISWFFEQVELGIILEDDCLPDITFFQFCGELLMKYQSDEDVFVISGTNLQNGLKRGNASYYFSNYPITWGWGTWRRAWRKFKFDLTENQESHNNAIFDHFIQSNSEKKFWERRIKIAKMEKHSIWDYQWFYAIWGNKGIGITPNVNLVTNIGFRNNASHTFLKDSIREPSNVYPIQFPLTHPEKKVDIEADKFTFDNAFSHSLARLFRLAKENGIIIIIKYFILKYKS